jgi:hypothetical protein
MYIVQCTQSTTPSETLLSIAMSIVTSVSTWQLTIGNKVGPDNVADDVIFVHPEKNKNTIIFFW